MYNINSLLLLLATVVLFSCNSTPTEKVSESGFKYILEVDKSGESAKPGDYVRYTEYIMKNDSAQWKAPGQPEGAVERELKIFAKDEIQNPIELAWYDALTLMSEGDSISLYASLDTITDLPPGITNDDDLSFHFKMLEITSKEEWEKQVNEPFEDVSYKKTASGFPYKLHTDEDGTTASTGDLVFYDQIIKVNRSKTTDTRDEKRLSKTFIPPLDSLDSPSPFIEAVTNMSEGDSMTVYWKLGILPEDQIPPSMKPTDIISYNVVLRKVLPGIFDKVKAYERGELTSQLTNAGEGLQYLVLEKGDGAMPANGQSVSVNYVGFLPNGRMFDSSFERKTTFDLQLGAGQVIPGWDRGLGLFPVGTKALLFIPSELAYGENGQPMAQIPPNTDLVFYVDILSAE